jgi:hypothetical protein
MVIDEEKKAQEGAMLWSRFSLRMILVIITLAAASSTRRRSID